MEISPPWVGLPHPGHYFADLGVFFRSACSFAFPQEYQVILLANVLETYLKQSFDVFGLLSNFDRELIAAWFKYSAFNVYVYLRVSQFLVA
jgi:hypothetical protein